jgi:hypothetical protein
VFAGFNHDVLKKPRNGRIISEKEQIFRAVIPVMIVMHQE